MDGGENPVKPQGPLVGKRVRNGSPPRRRAVRKMCILVAIVFTWGVCGACGGAPQPGNQKLKWFACKDRDKCPKLMDIYEHGHDGDDVHLYSKDKDGFPECSANRTPPQPKTCTVCHVQDQIYIVCAADVGEIDVEADGSIIGNISAVDECQHNRADNGPAPSLIWTVLAAAAAFVVHSSLLKGESPLPCHFIFLKSSSEFDETDLWRAEGASQH